jgi:hypothetical protein
VESNVNFANHTLSGLPDPVANTQPVTLAYFNAHSSGSGDKIQNTAGTSSVTVGNDDVTRFVSNGNQIMEVKQTALVTQGYIFSEADLAVNPLNQVLCKNQNDQLYYSKGATVDLGG